MVAPLARLVSSIATSAGAGLLVMAIFSRQAPTLANLQLDLHSQALPLCRTSHDRTRDNIHSCSLPQHSAFPSYFCCVPHAQAAQPGLRPLFFRKDFVRRITSAFIFSLEGGVLLLFEFLSGFSYFSSRLRRLRFSFEAFPRYGANSHSPYVAHRWLHASTASQMSAFSRLAIYP